MIYLDIDGVMITARDAAQQRDVIPQHRIDTLTRILDATGAALILASDWRRSSDGIDLLKAADLWRYTPNARRLRIDWKTASFLDGLDDNRSQRGQYIDDHQRRYPSDRVLIIDDSAVLDSQADLWLSIDPDIGLIDADYYRAMQLWNTQAMRAASVT